MRQSDNRNKKHWIAWEDLCFPGNGGGAGFRDLKDKCRAFSAKLWWKFRIQNTMFKKFLEAKYCKRFHDVAKRWAYGQSHTWKRLMEIKLTAEPLIFWKLGNCEISFCWDQWNKLGTLATLVQNQRTPKNLLVKDFFHNETENYNKLRNKLPINVVNTSLRLSSIWPIKIFLTGCPIMLVTLPVNSPGRL